MPPLSAWHNDAILVYVILSEAKDLGVTGMFLLPPHTQILRHCAPQNDIVFIRIAMCPSKRPPHKDVVISLPFSFPFCYNIIKYAHIREQICTIS